MFNKYAINILIEKVDINIFYDIVNKPDKYYNLITETLKIYYANLGIHYVEHRP